LTGPWLSLIAAVTPLPDAGQEPYVYVPFLKPLPAWGDDVWPWLLLPLCLGVAVVYKSIKCQSMARVPKEAAVLTAWILTGMAIAAVVLGLIVETTQWMNA
jgi:hypothetical protein